MATVPDHDLSLIDLPNIGKETAIRGVRWHTIPKDERERLWREYQRRLRHQAFPG